MSKDAAFCYLCMRSKHENKFLASKKREMAFISTGFTYWKEATLQRLTSTRQAPRTMRLLNRLYCCHHKFKNQQFYSIFTRENKNHIPPISFTRYPSMANIKFTTQGIVKILEELKPGKSAGPDNIPIWILKEYAMLIAPVLQVICTQSYQTGILPSDWLTANIVPVYKKGDKSSPTNYRPISLTSICCKTMEHIIYHSIMDHLNTYILLST